MQRVLLLSASVVAMTWAANAVADSPNLKGAYGFTGTAACLVAPGSASTAPLPGNTTPLPNSGFNAFLHPNDAKVFSHSNAVEGIRTFNGDGTGSVKGTSVGITVPPTPQPPGYPAFPPAAGSAVFSYNFHLYGQRRWQLDRQDGSGQLSRNVCDRAAQYAKSGKPYQPDRHGRRNSAGHGSDFAGRQDPDPRRRPGNLARAYSTANGFTPTVETVTYSNGDVYPQICHRSRVLISLGNGRGGKDD